MRNARNENNDLNRLFAVDVNLSRKQAEGRMARAWTGSAGLNLSIAGLFMGEVVVWSIGKRRARGALASGESKLMRVE